MAILRQSPLRLLEDRTASAWVVATLVVTITPFVAAVALAPRVHQPAGPTLAWLLFVGSSVHVGATAWLYCLPEVRACTRESRARYVIVPAVVVAAAPAIALSTTSSQFAWVLVPFLAWQLFHFQRQNLGLVALTARATKSLALDGRERRLIAASAIAGITALLARPDRLQLDVEPGVHWLFPAAAVAYIAVALTGTTHVVRRRRNDHPAAVVMLLASYAFFVPVFLFDSPFAAIAGLTIAHGLQYLVLLGFIGAARQRAHVVAGATLLVVAFASGAILHGLSHLDDADQAAGRALFGAYLGVVMAHFVIDAGLWRLRDPRARAFLSAYLPQLVGEAPPT